MFAIECCPEITLVHKVYYFLWYNEINGLTSFRDVEFNSLSIETGDYYNINLSRIENFVQLIGLVGWF